jgi:hypothetical protein
MRPNVHDPHDISLRVASYAKQLTALAAAQTSLYDAVLRDNDIDADMWYKRARRLATEAAASWPLPDRPCPAAAYYALLKERFET